MSDSTVNVSGSDQAYGIDAVRVGVADGEGVEGDYRQVLVVGDFANSGIDGSMAAVAASALYVSAVGGTITANLGATDNAVLDSILTKNTEIDAVLDTILTKNTEIDTALDTIDGVLDNSLTKQTEIDTAIDTIDGVLDNILTKNTEIDAVLDTIKIDTEAIETAVEGTLTVSSINNHHLKHVFIDADANGDNPQTNTDLIAAPGADLAIVVYGYQLATLGTANTTNGSWALTDGDYATATVVAAGFIAAEEGTDNTSFSTDKGIALTANTELSFSVAEAAVNVLVRGVVYYRIEAV